jgi:uncharacterized protein (TIRG00374 family)
MKKKIGIAFLIISLIILSYFLYNFGLDALEIIKLNINYYYLSIFIAILLISFIPYVMRFKVILDAFGKKVSILQLIPQTMVAFAVSYITPASRLGGEPARIYLLKKESDVDYTTATSSVVLDKFIEILGSALYGIIGFILLLQLPGLPDNVKIIFGVVVLLALIILYWIFHRYKSGKDVISKLITFAKIKNHIKEIDDQIRWMFKYRKGILLKSFMYYVITGILYIVQFKYLLLSIGIDSTISELILIINLWGILNFIPSPGSIGFLEGGQAMLFDSLKGEGVLGLAMTLILRAGYLTIVCLGFLYVSRFGIKYLRNIK